MLHTIYNSGSRIGVNHSGVCHVLQGRRQMRSASPLPRNALFNEAEVSQPMSLWPSGDVQPRHATLEDNLHESGGLVWPMNL